MVFLISNKFCPKKFVIHTFVSETLHENYNISKAKKYYFILLKLACSLYFHIRSNIISSKKSIGPPMPLKHCTCSTCPAKTLVLLIFTKYETMECFLVNLSVRLPIIFIVISKMNENYIFVCENYIYIVNLWSFL